MSKRLAEAVDQLKKYAPTLDSFGEDVSAFAIVFALNTGVERVNVGDIGTYFLILQSIPLCDCLIL